MQDDPKTSGGLLRRRNRIITWISRFPRLFGLTVAVILGIAIVAPFYLARHETTLNGTRVPRLIYTHDLVMHLPQAQEFDRVLRSGVIYPRWLANINKGYGITTMVFYPPLVYYSISLFHAIFRDWVYGLFALSALGMAGSGLTLYLLARLFLGRFASVVASLFYMLLPFHVLNLYWQGSVGQFLSHLFLPLLLYFAYRLGSFGRLRDYAALGFFYGLFLLTQLPVAYLFTYTLAMYAVVWAVKERDLKIILRLALGMSTGLLMSAIYWLPAALEAKYVYEWASELFPYHTTYITLLGGGDAFGSRLNDLFALHALALAAAVWVVHATRSSAEPGQSTDSQSQKSSQTQIKLWMVMGITTLLMSTSFSIYVSKLIPKIQIAVPAWRWLVIAGVFTALLVGVAVERLKQQSDLLPRKVLIYRAAIGLVVISNVWFSVHRVIIGALANPTYYPPAMYIDSGFTPKNSTPPDYLPETPLATILPDSGVVEVTRWDPQHREVAVRVDQPTELRLKTYNFPGWSAHIDGEKAALSSDKDGAQVIQVPPGVHHIQADFVDTPPRRLGSILSAVGLLIMASVIALDYKRQASWRFHRPSGQVPAKVSSEEPQGITTAEWSGPGPKVIVIGIAIGVLLVAVVLAWWLRSSNQSSRRRESTRDAGSSESKSRPPANIGSEVRVHLEGAASVPMGVDERALDELMAALSNRSSDQVEALVQSGRVIQVDNDTRVRLLEMGLAKLKVRILEGTRITSEAWVPERWVR